MALSSAQRCLVMVPRSWSSSRSGLLWSVYYRFPKAACPDRQLRIVSDVLGRISRSAPSKCSAGRRRLRLLENPCRRSDAMPFRYFSFGSVPQPESFTGTDFRTASLQRGVAPHPPLTLFQHPARRTSLVRIIFRQPGRVCRTKCGSRAHDYLSADLPDWRLGHRLLPM
jgi:hypothetical protein